MGRDVSMMNVCCEMLDEFCDMTWEQEVKHFRACTELCQTNSRG